MIEYQVIVVGENRRFSHAFDGEPQINLTFEQDGCVYKVVTRAHDEDATVEDGEPTIHVKIV